MPTERALPRVFVTCRIGVCGPCPKTVATAAPPLPLPPTAKALPVCKSSSPAPHSIPPLINAAAAWALTFSRSFARANACRGGGRWGEGVDNLPLFAHRTVRRRAICQFWGYRTVSCNSQSQLGFPAFENFPVNIVACAGMYHAYAYWKHSGGG